MKNDIENMNKRFLMLYPARNTGLDVIKEIENALGVNFPWDFIEISKFFDGYYSLGGINLFSFDFQGDYSNIKDETIRLRESINLPKKYVVLYESEVSFIVLETQSAETLNARVIDCSLEDAYNLVEGKDLENGPVIYETFFDFFENLVSAEEQEKGLVCSGSLSPPE